MKLCDLRRDRGLSQEQLAHELGLKSKGRICDIENGAVDCPLELALKIQAWSGGEVRAAELRPDLAHLIAEAGRPLPPAAAVCSC